MNVSRFHIWSEKFGRWFTLLSGLWLACAALLLALWISRESFDLSPLLAGYLTLTVSGSCVAFVAYGIDKRRAKKDKRRISEKFLQRLALAGGWPGAVLAQRTFHHKTRKMSFQLKFRLIVALHLAVLVFGFLL